MEMLIENLFQKKFSSFDILNTSILYCPLCKNIITFQSEYLANIFKDNFFTYWSACLVTHYRHEHIKYYDRSWKSYYYALKNPEYNGYEEYKILVNNRAKRQLIRAICKDDNMKILCKQNLISSFLNLQYNDDKTKTLINKKIKEFENDK